MDPNCAICDGPPKNRCDCEFRTLVHAVEESEQRVLEPMYDEIRYFSPSSLPLQLPPCPYSIANKPAIIVHG
jgi:hypothetical protein